MDKGGKGNGGGQTGRPEGDDGKEEALTGKLAGQEGC